MPSTTSPYHYSPLKERRSIRLLRLLPHEDENASIKCDLFDYTLCESGKGAHPYQALSYVWGDSSKPKSIFVGNHEVPVTSNLHTALLRLRDRFIERVLWIDAICINQEDLKERGHQVQYMAQIYGKSSRVIVWLGKAEADSDRALRGILAAANEEPKKCSNDQTLQQSICTLLQRQWFRRIWVLQEAAAARQILMICGSTEIDGYAFCLGLQSLNLSYDSFPDLKNLIHSVTPLIRGAIFRPSYEVNSSGHGSLSIRSLGELVDMYHTHDATDRRDKVYALLGMSSDKPEEAGLVPDYEMLWQNLLKKLIKFLLCEQTSVETWGNAEMAIIKSKGSVLGRVDFLDGNGGPDGRQKVHITLQGKPYSPGYRIEWVLHASAKSILVGDFVCFLEGASKPLIVRARRDYFAIVMIAVTPLEERGTGGVDDRQPELQISQFPHHFLLVWDWGKSSTGLQYPEEYEALEPPSRPEPAHSTTVLGSQSDKMTRLWDVAAIFEDLGDYKGAEDRLRVIVEDYENALGKQHPRTLIVLERLALVYKKNMQWKEAAELFEQVLQTRRRSQRANDRGMVSSMANLAETYRNLNRFRKAARLVAMTDILGHTGDYTHITEEAVIQTARLYDKEVMMTLLERRRLETRITGRAIMAAAENWNHRREIMVLLIERAQDKVQITQEVITRVAGSSEKEATTLLLEKWGNEIEITEDAVAQIAKSCDAEVMKLLFQKKRNQIQATETVISAAAENQDYGKEVMVLLLEEESGDVQITDRMAMAAADNHKCGNEVMSLLIERLREDQHITAGLITRIAGSFHSDVMGLLLQKRVDDIQITEGVISAAAGNRNYGKEVMMMLLERMWDNLEEKEVAVSQIARSFDKEVMLFLLEKWGNEARITEAVVAAAMRNHSNRNEVLLLLLKRMGEDVRLTEEVVAQIVGSCGREVVVAMRLQLEKSRFKLQIAEVD